METLYDIHTEHLEIESDIKFYVSELDFLVSIITKDMDKPKEESNTTLLHVYFEGAI